MGCFTYHDWFAAAWQEHSAMTAERPSSHRRVALSHTRTHLVITVEKMKPATSVTEVSNRIRTNIQNRSRLWGRKKSGCGDAVSGVKHDLLWFRFLTLADGAELRFGLSCRVFVQCLEFCHVFFSASAFDVFHASSLRYN